MSKKIQITLKFDQNIDDYVKLNYATAKDFRILSKSLDARGAPKGTAPKYHYKIELSFPGDEFEMTKISNKNLGPLKQMPLIVGAGPAGLFCALRLLEFGIPSRVVERGDPAHKRMLSIAKFWRYGILNPESNVCFGEGGAGLFSDGKLITRIKSPYISYVMDKFVEFGAPKEVAYLSNPHLGSNKIRNIISAISKYLTHHGCEVLTNCRVDEILFDDDKVSGIKCSNQKIYYSSNVVLATGHSAHDMYQFLEKSKVSMSTKDFAVGLRIEHPREYMNQIQYGRFSSCSSLETAKYQLKFHDNSTGRGIYSFCMCPGGYVLSSGTDMDGIVTNGMSNYSRHSHWSNSAIVVSVRAGEDFISENPLSGLDYQKSIEKRAYSLSKEYCTGKEIPASTIDEFFQGKINSKKLPASSVPSKLIKISLDRILPSVIIEKIRQSLDDFDRKIPGFKKNALLIAPETRTSSPVRIVRDKLSLESTTHRGLYPCGEGAGHAGGITSSAVDGVKVANAIISKEKSFSF